MSETDPTVMNALVANHRRFLQFLERRTASRADAEDILQAAFVRALEKGGGLRAEESAVAWFYRLLRNALADRYRSDAARGRSLEALGEDLGDDAQTEVEDPALHAEVCRCVVALLPGLKPEYAQLVQRVDLDGEAVNRTAHDLGITPNNASVRLHRARKALLREVQRSCGTCATHGCLDCTCGQPGRARGGAGCPPPFPEEPV